MAKIRKKHQERLKLFLDTVATCLPDAAGIIKTASPDLFETPIVEKKVAEEATPPPPVESIEPEEAPVAEVEEPPQEIVPEEPSLPEEQASVVEQVSPPSEEKVVPEKPEEQEIVTEDDEKEVAEDEVSDELPEVEQPALEEEEESPVEEAPSQEEAETIIEQPEPVAEEQPSEDIVIEEKEEEEKVAEQPPVEVEEPVSEAEEPVPEELLPDVEPSPPQFLGDAGTFFSKIPWDGQVPSEEEEIHIEPASGEDQLRLQRGRMPNMMVAGLQSAIATSKKLENAGEKVASSKEKTAQEFFQSIPWNR